MKAQDYTVAHFNLMADLAIRLSSKSVQLLEHSYNHEAFGSWWFICKSSGQQFRIVFDGKDYLLRIQISAGKHWKDIASHQARESDSVEMATYIIEALKKYRVEMHG